MSDTPKTDQCESEYYNHGTHVDEVFEFARLLERELAEAKARIALQDMNMACLDDIVNGDDRSGMTPDTTLVQQVAIMKRKLDDWENAARFVEDPPCDEVHCGCIEILRALLGKARQERDEAREYIRARPPVQYLVEHSSVHDSSCPCGECTLWRKAAGITDEPASGAWAHQIVPSMKLCPTCRAWHGGDSCYACTPSSGVDAEGLTQKHKSK